MQKIDLSKKPLLFPSMMCSNLEKLEDEIKYLDAKVDVYHCDIMDGKFVNNIALSLDQINIIRKNTKKLVDAHLMVVNPFEITMSLMNIGIDIVYYQLESFHTEAELMNCYSLVKECGKKFGVVIPNGLLFFDKIKDLNSKLNIDAFVVMGGAIGVTGHTIDMNVIQTIEKLNSITSDEQLTILDGGVTIDVISNFMYKLNGFVLGTNVVFRKKNRNYDLDFKLIEKLRK